MEEKKITTVCIGKPHLNLFQVILRTNVFNQLLKTLSKNDVDLDYFILMAIKLKTKVALGGIFLFALLILVGAVSFYYFNQITRGSQGD